eukprot:CAMPEP_0197890836 /NCGR_PEP_ID=MMETSP1439-20131203/27233_1 /TAXON_ID=66791 /ORGANISM="Gonyaulax spinifera, Strain CCMP409" /LENGTH=95 /DNA_ID=CAMNT_0043510897 /DNA_START=328 /DNA_END=612 /DNA_ORIENTATION=-
MPRAGHLRALCVSKRSRAWTDVAQVLALGIARDATGLVGVRIRSRASRYVVGLGLGRDTGFWSGDCRGVVLRLLLRHPQEGSHPAGAKSPWCWTW